ncbi:MAG: TraV family lipoprotein [Emcibacter sp.]|nr:TraV family lipoprotein [Emcibacter sp.]
MRYFKFILITAGFHVVAACSTLGGNVSGNWSCGRDQGKGCLTTHEIDERVLEEQNGIAMPAPVKLKRFSGFKLTANLSFDDGLSDMSNNEPPARTADQIGRVVIMPFVDTSGIYHARAVVYAVMEEGGWKSSTRKPAFKKPSFSKPPFQKPVLEKPDFDISGQK